MGGKKWILTGVWVACMACSSFAAPPDPADCGCAEDEVVDPDCEEGDCSTFNPLCCIPMDAIPIGDPSALSGLVALGTGLAGLSLYRKQTRQ